MTVMITKIDQTEIIKVAVIEGIIRTVMTEIDKAATKGTFLG